MTSCFLQYAVIQLNPQLLSLLKIKEPSESNELQLHSHIRGFSVVDDFLLLWDDTKVKNYGNDCFKIYGFLRSNWIISFLPMTPRFTWKQLLPSILTFKPLSVRFTTRITFI